MVKPNRTWAEIHLDRAAHNLNEIQKRTGSKVIAVIKADAYGHGALELARLYESMQVPYFAVACVQEGLELRAGGIKTPILVFGMSTEEEVDAAIERDITLTVYSTESAKRVSAAAQRKKSSVRVHVKVDTGMSRIGFPFDAEDEILQAASLPGILSEGIFTHFADAENEDETFTNLQFQRFDELVQRLNTCGLSFKICHCANSAAVLHYKKAWTGYVRAGIILYGCQAGKEVDWLKPVMEFKSQICDIRTVREGETISYGRTYRAAGERRIAVIPAGYADGVRRSLSNRGSVLVRGKTVPIVGRVCMDMTMLDVTEYPEIQLGDEVTLFGTGAPADALAETAGTISYELCCGVSKRVPRIYFS